MRILITAGPTREPIDAVRFIGNRSSGRLGLALAAAAVAGGHDLTVILGPVTAGTIPGARRIDVETAAEMHAAVLAEFPRHDLLIMAAAVADYRPRAGLPSGKIERHGPLTLELEPTADIAAAAGAIKRSDQRTVGFSLEASSDLSRAQRKLREKNLDLIVHNTVQTINSPAIEPVLIYPDGRSEPLPPRTKEQFAEELLGRCDKLFE
jgi:phosphopantothenoylcysteine decarboxylase/phosphopantothenate--cysteine ligase